MNTKLSSQKVELADVFNLFGDEYRKNHKLTLQHRNVMFAIEACRTKRLGGHVDACNSCGYKRISYNSCRNRHCPKCQNLNKEKWVDALASSILPTKYFHIVFTIPSELNRICLVNQKVLYDILFHAASQTILTLAKDKKHLGALTGLVAVLHTWGQNLMDHPHLHTLVPAGGWSDTNAKLGQATQFGYWKNCKKNFFIPVKVLSEMFRGKFLAALKTAYLNGELKFEGEIKSLAQIGNFKNLLSSMYKKNWVVYSKNSIKNSAGIIKYLGNYSHRIAITNNRIKSICNETVSFEWKDYKDNNKKKLMNLNHNEFIRRFLLHVLPPRYCKIRYYGIFSARNRKTILQQCKRVMAKKEIKSIFVGLKWHEVLKITTGVDVLKCPHCKTGTMVQTELFKGHKAPT
jgi:predicted Zn-ribbon and HTH transcriptional regulator